MGTQHRGEERSKTVYTSVIYLDGRRGQHVEKEIIMAIVTAIIGLWLGRIEYKMREQYQMFRDTPNRREVSEEFEIRLESVKVLQNEIKDDIKEIRRAIERLTDRH